MLTFHFHLIDTQYMLEKDGQIKTSNFKSHGFLIALLLIGLRLLSNTFDDYTTMQFILLLFGAQFVFNIITFTIYMLWINLFHCKWSRKVNIGLCVLGFKKRNMIRPN